MEPLEMLERAFDSTGGRIGRLTPDQANLPTPCAEWDVHTLVAHTVGVTATFEAVAAGTPSEGDPMALGERLVAGGPAPAFQKAAAATLDAWRRRGSLEGAVVLPTGAEVPAEVGHGICYLDCLVHGWDIAKAARQDATLDPELAEAAIGIAGLIVTDAVRGSAGFAPAINVGSDTSPTDRLVAFLGRRP
jgi:uncharacterized protein (TIGR03086 family)